MMGRTVSHKFTFGANGLIRITIEFQMTDINPHPANARNTWLAARNVAYKHALRVRGIRRPALQNARTGHSNRQLGANRLSRRRAEGAYKAVFCWLSAAASSRKPSCRRNYSPRRGLTFLPGAGSISSRISNRLGLFTCPSTVQLLRAATRSLAQDYYL